MDEPTQTQPESRSELFVSTETRRDNRSENQPAPPSASVSPPMPAPMTEPPAIRSAQPGRPSTSSPKAQGPTVLSVMQRVVDFFARRARATAGGGPKAVEKQVASGKLTARDRIKLILDPNSFHEYDLFVEHKCVDFDMGGKALAADGVISGTGKISGHPVCIFAQDFTVAGGSLGLMHARKITKIMDHAMKLGIPLIGINDSGGARIQEGVNSLAGYGEIFFRNTLASGVIPQISVVLGPCAGGAVYSPALTDFVFVVDKISRMFITGPEVIKTVLGEEISMEDLGGARVNTEVSGNAHFYAESESECFEQIKKLVTFIPWNNKKRADSFPPRAPKAGFDLAKIIPADPRRPFDVRDVVRAVCDDSEIFEVQARWAPNIVTGFARLKGQSVGVVANQPMVLAGVLDVDSSDKAARFVRFCDAFNIPLVTFVDLPGYLPGIDQEHAGVIRHGAKLLYAYSEATVPKITVILRKAYGGGYIAMCSRHLGADFVFAWPSAEIAVMGPEGAANIIFRKEITEASNPDEVRRQKVLEYTQKFANPYLAAAAGYIDAVIAPEETRDYLLHAIEISESKTDSRPAKKHGIPPF
jgi:methylmalonyl-CoA decarboxylase subunit alpha